MASKNPTFATRWNADLIDEKYQIWLDEPEAVETHWQAFFEGFHLAAQNGAQPRTAQADTFAATPTNGEACTLSDFEVPVASGVSEVAIKQARFTGAIYAYRSIGHTQAAINPLYREVPINERLSLKRLGFGEADLEEIYFTGNYLNGTMLSVGELVERLKATYCQSIGVEYLHIQETPRRRWLQANMEPSNNQGNFSDEKKIRILEKIMQAEQFEKFLHTRFVGQKRFGLEGGETFIAALDHILESAPSLGFEEAVLGMAHRGRLNVLANILGKSYEYIFHEFSENYVPDTIHGDGDVKYHLGFDSVVRNSRNESIILHLAANPSHLEAVNPVVEGRTRARQRILGDMERKRVLPVLIHGDAAFAGQGIVAEVLNFSQLPGYTTGGTIHFVINNQIGFTTDPSEARSTRYCTDVAKMIEAPIFHVNGDDPLAVVWAMDMALRYRQEFGSDVVIDMYCYRRHGHNESDEPAFTQPTLYRKINEHPLISETYANALQQSGVLDGDKQLKEIAKRYRDRLEQAFKKEKPTVEKPDIVKKKVFKGSTAIFQPGYNFRDIKTAVEANTLNHVAKALTTVPERIQANPKIVRQLQTKWEAYEKDTGIDWAFAESLAWGSLMLEGTPVRLSGQDSARGTFSQRHAVIYDMQTREPYLPLMNMPNRKAMICVHNSLLSEAAVLGFDYGYSLDYPQMLCMWEAQFGDFVNGAQVIIDQFIVSSESKWQRVSGLVMLLPHGYEGQGPEHSSARLERFLQACAEDNIQVCNLSTPAQYFHVLRRQVKRDFRKPLVIMAPKSLLRHKSCVSSRKDFTDDHFHSVLDDPLQPRDAERIVLCSGKVYYDLLAYQEANKDDLPPAAIVRVEQFYPFNAAKLQEIVAPYSKQKKIVWCQEEPENMGASRFIRPLITQALQQEVHYAGRPAAASPAVGTLVLHKIEQEGLIEAALAG